MYGNGTQNQDGVQYSSGADDPGRVTGIVTSSNDYHRMAPVVKVPPEEMAWTLFKRREDPDKRLATWSWVQFLGVCSCFVGLQMTWVLPGFIAQRTAASFVPFYLGYFAILLPLMYVQMRVGGTTRKNIVSLFAEYCPILQGVGIVNVIRLFLITIYFNVFVAYLINYGMGAMGSPLTWSQCEGNYTAATCDNTTANFWTTGAPSEAIYFQDTVLEASTAVYVEGTIPKHLGVALLAAWVITFVCTMCGVKVFGWVMALFGAVATILAIAVLAYGREELQHAMLDDVIYKPDWDSLKGPTTEDAFIHTWLDGIFHAIMMGQAWSGIFPTLGKYNGKLTAYTHGRWVLLFLFLCIMPHLFIYLVSTYMSALAAVAGVELGDVMVGSINPSAGNYTLLFINFPAAFHHLGLKQGLTFVFYFMMFLYAIQAQALWALVAIDNITDCIRPKLTSWCKPCGNKSCTFILVSAIYCALGLALGIPLITQAGIYLVTLLMHWIDKLIFVLAFFSFIAFTVTYAKLHYSLINKVLFLIWFSLASILSTALMLYKAGLLSEAGNFATQVLYRQDYEYPPWTYALAWFLAAGPIVLGLLFGAIHAVASAPGTKCEKCAYACCAGSDDPDGEHPQKDRKNNNRMLSDGEDDYLDPKH